MDLRFNGIAYCEEKEEKLYFLNHFYSITKQMNSEQVGCKFFLSFSQISLLLLNHTSFGFFGRVVVSGLVGYSYWNKTGSSFKLEMLQRGKQFAPLSENSDHKSSLPNRFVYFSLLIKNY